jgi:FixJ family two-component response regulator
VAGKSRESAETEHLIVGVDDDYRVRESLASLLESAGYRSSMFASGEDFLRSEDLGGADCLVTDLRMPGMDGLQLARSIREIRPKLPVIFISAHFEEGTRRIALEEGALGFLYKPFVTAELLELIRSALPRRCGSERLPEA